MWPKPQKGEPNIGMDDNVFSSQNWGWLVGVQGYTKGLPYILNAKGGGHICRKRGKNIQETV